MAPLLKVENLTKHFATKGGLVRAVENLSFSIERRETLGLVGESGCGKSTVGRAILNLVTPTSGRILFQSREMDRLAKPERRNLRREMGIVFQNPYSSLNPRMKVLEIIGEPLKVYHGLKGHGLYSKVAQLVEQVGLKAEHLNRYPHQFSGGQRQRIAISRSLALNPKFLILDEPTSALDVSVQSQVLNLLRRLQREMDLTYLFISHDLDVVRHIANRMLVMYLGTLVEAGPVNGIFQNPVHPYTQALLSANPRFDPSDRRERVLLEGDVPSPTNPPPGCRFHTRCPRMIGICCQKQPELKTIGNQKAACHLV